ncbi:MAG: restriction endonuclease subunit S [Pseudomonadota bacterium]
MSMFPLVPLTDMVDIYDYLREPISQTERNKREGAYPYFGATGQVGWIDGYRQDGRYVLLGEDGAPFLDPQKNKAYLVEGKCWVNNHAHVLKGKDGVCDDDFLCFALNWADYSEAVTGSTRLKLPQNTMNRLYIPRPNIDQQRQIAARLKAQLTEVETARQAAQVQLRDARLLSTKIIDSVFDQFKEWQPIAEVAKVQSGYAFKSENFKPSGVRLLRNANILPGEVYWDDVVYLAPCEGSRYPNYVLEEGDVLISLDRPLISSGIKVARVGEADLPALLLQRVGRFVLKPNIIDADFLYGFLQSSRFIDAISGHDQSLGVPHISPGQVESVEIPLLPLDDQRRIVAHLKTQLVEADVLRAALLLQQRDLDNLPQRILAQAFDQRENQHD